MITAIVGANWGDEGKGKITDYLADNADIVVRFQGGANAGHTIINSYGKFALHLLPSGLFSPHVTNLIGPGVAFDVERFFAELEEVQSRGIRIRSLLVSDRAQVMMPYHVLLDSWEEERLAGESFGSTKSGIAPFYSDKYAKLGFQLCELYDDDALAKKLRRVLEIKNVLIEHLYHRPPMDERELLAKLIEWREKMRPYLCDSSALLDKARAEGRRILLEGQLGTLKDPDHGIYPMVTSSSPLAGYGAVGAGVPPYEIKRIVAVTKAYSSAVGAGAFVSEILDADAAEELRRRGGDAGEYGATTGRPRRVGWFDCVATRYGFARQGATEAALTNLDVLGYLPEIPVCVAYECDGERIDAFPATPTLARCRPVIEALPGWNRDLRGAKSYDELPDEAKAYVAFIEKACGVKITLLSTGPAREELIVR